MKYDVLIPSFRRLYDALRSVDPESLLNVDRPALDFLPPEFKVKKRYPEPILQSLKNAAQAHRDEVVLVLQFVVPRLREGLERQRGSWMGFGETLPEDARLVSYDPVKLQDAPINNIASEQAVGRINHGLKRRGAKELAAASRELVSGQSDDLINKFPASEHRKMHALIGPESEFHSLKKEWSEAQEDLEEEAFDRKQAAKRAQDRTRNKDLEFLKAAGGPFTTVESLEEFLSSSELERDKQILLYHEVRLAKYSSVSIKRDDEIFRLMRNHKKLSIEEYGRNLRVYLDKITVSATATLADFQNAICDLLD